jgi:transposase
MIKRKIKKQKTKPILTCIYCDEKIEAKRRQAVYCTPTCRQYYYYFRCQLPNTFLNRASISTYAMEFMPEYLKANYSSELHESFAKEDGKKIRQWIDLNRLEKEANELLQSKM